MLPRFFAAATTCGHNLFGVFPPWWAFLPTKPNSSDNCSIAIKHITDIWLIGLAVIDDLLILAGFVAVISIIFAGFEYVFSLGNSDKITAARKRIQNSLIGLAVALIAIGTVSFIGKTLGQ